MELAQVNVAHAVAPLDTRRMDGFTSRHDRLDREARRSPGFVWRPRAEEIDPADLALFGDPRRSPAVRRSPVPW